MLRCLAKVTFLCYFSDDFGKTPQLGGSPLYEESVAEEWWGIAVMIAVVLYHVSSDESLCDLWRL